MPDSDEHYFLMGSCRNNFEFSKWFPILPVGDIEDFFLPDNSSAKRGREREGEYLQRVAVPDFRMEREEVSSSVMTIQEVTVGNLEQERMHAAYLQYSAFFADMKILGFLLKVACRTFGFAWFFQTFCEFNLM